MAQVTKVVGHKYHVYFPEDSQSKTLTLGNVRPVQEGCTFPTRRDLLNEEFEFEGDDDLSPGRWKVRQIQDNNVYKCVRVSGGEKKEPNVDEFDVGYVIKSWMAERQQKRERGLILQQHSRRFP